jgi:hypothetical protein
MRNKEFDGKEAQELEQAEARLKKAEADLESARAAEQSAEHEIDEALQVIGDAEAHHHHEIHFTVDGEPEETELREVTPNEIILEYGHKDPATCYLIRIEDGHEKDNYRDKGTLPIKLHDGMEFQMISLGPTPVSDGPIRVGVEVFIEGLKALGYNPMALSKRPDHIVIDYEVPAGRFAGKKVRHGFVVPFDFPVTPPSGPHVSPHIHPINPQDTGHPFGGVHQAQAVPFAEEAGGQWQYWSRPFKDWREGKKTVADYMRHIWCLWTLQ